MNYSSRLIFTFLIGCALQNIQASQVAQINIQNPTDLTEINNFLLNSPRVPSLEQAEKALAAGANVNAQDEDGNTALDLAVAKAYSSCTYYQNLDCVRTWGSNFAPLLYGPTFAADIAFIKLLVASGATLISDYNKMFLNSPNAMPLLETYQTGLAIYEQRKEDHAAYEKHIADNLHDYVSIKDLHNIIAEYNKMSILQFVAYQKQNAAK